jgi:hypothetical protein
MPNRDLNADDEAPATLVRPDGFVAWRNSGEAADCATELREALANSLGN